MIDKKTLKDQSLNAPQTEPQPPSQEADAFTRAQADPKSATKTKGEKYYGRVIGTSTYVTTYGASLGSAYFLKYNRTGNEKILKPIVERLENFFSKNKWLGGDNPASRANNVGEIGSLMAGGTIPVVPFKIIEDNRIGIIKHYNERHGSGIDDPELEAIAQERIENLPIQSWGSALAGRATAMGATLAFGIPKLTADPIERAQLKVSNAMYDSKFSLGRLIRPRTEEAARTIDKYIVMDGTWSAFTSVILLIGSRVGAVLFHGNKNSGEKLPDDSHPHRNTQTTMQQSTRGELTQQKLENTKPLSKLNSALPADHIRDTQHHGPLATTQELEAQL